MEQNIELNQDAKYFLDSIKEYPTLKTLEPEYNDEIRFTIDDKVYKLDPKEDITALESLRITQLLEVQKTWWHTNYSKNFLIFIEKYKLQRHFKEVER